jgi:hypothetical protein
MTIWTFDRDDVRWVGPVTVTDNGVPITNYTVSVYIYGGRPASWAAPDVQPGGTALGVLVGAGTKWPMTAARGTYVIRAREVGTPETESVEVGRIVTL